VSLRAVPPEQLARQLRCAVYTTIVVLAVIVALDEYPVAAGEALSYVAGAAIASVLAEVYADYIASVVAQRRHLDASERVAVLRDAVSGLLAALVPAACLVFAAAGAVDVQTALDVAKWTGAGALGAYAYLANRIAGFSAARSALIGASLAALGVVLIALKAAVH
jgi:hypothetical protein